LQCRQGYVSKTGSNIGIEMAKSKTKKSRSDGDGSGPRYLGVKIHGGQKVQTGQIIIRQRGTKFLAGKNVKRGRDDTLYSLVDGLVGFQTKRIRGFDNKARRAKIVNVIHSPALIKTPQ